MYETTIEFKSETPEKRLWVIETKEKVKMDAIIVVGHRRGMGTVISSVKKEK